MKKLTISFLIMSLLLLTNEYPLVGALAQPGINIIMVDKTMNFEYLDCEVKPIIEDSYTLVPLRAIAEKLGYTVDWDADSQSVSIHSETSDLALTIGSKTAVANSREVLMPISPKIVEDRVFIPLRFAAEFFGKQVTWKKGIDSFDFIWISDLELLNDSDVDVPNDPNYYVLSDDPVPYYALKPDGTTARGIRIGDEYGEVIDKYGEPHERYVINDSKFMISYFTPYLPASGSGSELIFYIRDNVVISVEIDPPV